MESNNKKILWADDEIDSPAFPHHMYLRERGYDVTPVNNGEDAIALAQKENFDIVLLDEMMPGLDGLATPRAAQGGQSEHSHHHDHEE